MLLCACRYTNTHTLLLDFCKCTLHPEKPVVMIYVSAGVQNLAFDSQLHLSPFLQMDGGLHGSFILSLGKHSLQGNHHVPGSLLDSSDNLELNQRESLILYSSKQEGSAGSH